MVRSTVWNDVNQGNRVKTKTIKQSVEFNASPHEVFECLMDSKKHSKFSGDAAKISRSVGGKISAYSGYISGENLKLVPDKKIVQSWHASDWPNGHFSKATFALSKTKNGTRLTFTQTGVPEEFFEDISLGWYEHYWDKMKLVFHQKN